MLRFLNPCIEKRVAKSFASISHVELQNNLSSKRPNNALQSYLKSNPSKTFLLFSDLLRRNTSLLDSYSLLYAIKACTKKAGAIEGKQVHTLVLKLGYEPIIFLQTSLVNMYSAAGNLADARRMFEEMPTRNVICWTSLVSAYVDNQEANAALEMFRRMQKENVKPDHVTLTVALSACADLGALEMGEWIHGYITQKSELNADLYLKNALINMYVKCGDIGRAKELFDNLKRKDVTSWTSMIVGYAVHGQAEDALRLYAAMEKESKSMTNKKCSHKAHLIIPNDVTFVGVLMACSHAGMLEEGKKYFRIMTEEFGLKPRLPHYGCMVDLFCRKGMLKDANEFILAMLVEPNAIIWRTLLGACTIHGNLDLAAEAYNKLLQLEESVVGDDVLMSNIYAAKEMWNEKLKVRDEIKQRRTPGHSTIEVGSCIYEFVSADDHHPLASDIYSVLDHLIGNMRTYSYASQFSTLTEYLM
nr:putative pentatricopeptide repeat-containing protein At1g74400 [Coffea arabica]